MSVALSARPVERPPLVGLLAAFAAVYLCWGSTFLAIRVAAAEFPPFVMVALRSLASGGALALFALTAFDARPSLAGWLRAVPIGACLFVGSHGIMTLAEQRISSSFAALASAAVPLWLPVLGWASRSMPRPTPRMVLSLAVGFAGVALLAWSGDRGGGGNDGGYVLLAFVSSFCWALGTVIALRRPASADSALLGASMTQIAGGVLCALVGLGRGEWPAFAPAAIGQAAWASFAYLIVFGSIVTFAAFSWLNKVCDPRLVSTYAFVNPVIAMVLGALILNETLTAQAIGAAVLIVGSVVAQLWPRRVNG